MISVAMFLCEASARIFIAYPPQNYSVTADSILIEGSVDSGASLKIDGRPVQVGKDGLFIEYWPLKKGMNRLYFQSLHQGKRTSHVLNVYRSSLVMPIKPTRIDQASIQPKKKVDFWDIEHDSLAEKTLTLSFRGSPGGQAWAEIAGQKIPLKEQTAGQYQGQWTANTEGQFVYFLRGKDNKVQSVKAAWVRIRHDPQWRMQAPHTVQGLALNEASYVAKTDQNKPFYIHAKACGFTL